MAEYIRRDVAIRKIEQINHYAGECLRDCKEAINSIPAADVAPVVHARWITCNDKGIISMTHPYMCSRCWRVEMEKEPYYNCGAKMDEGE